MGPARYQVTVARMLMAGLASAALTPFTVDALSGITVVAVWWLPLALVCLGFCAASNVLASRLRMARFPARLRIGSPLWALLVSFFVGALWLALEARLASQGVSLYDAVLILITPVNLSGVPSAVWRLRTGGRITGGEVIWAWLGLVWPTVLVHWDAHLPPATITIMAQCSGLCSYMAVLVFLFGLRPVTLSERIAHNAGWLLMGCDVCMWGLYARGYAV